MALAYSEDLRKRAVNLVENGKDAAEVAKLLSIGRATVYLWLARKRTEGTIAPRKGWHKGHSNKITDLEEFKRFVEENQGMTAVAMAEKWGNISAKTMCKWLKRIGFTRKKKLITTSNKTKKAVLYIST